MRLTELAHSLIRESISSGDSAIDATAGNGHDTLFLAQTVGRDGRILAFDIQQDAIDQTAGCLEQAGVAFDSCDPYSEFPATGLAPVVQRTLPYSDCGASGSVEVLDEGGSAESAQPPGPARWRELVDRQEQERATVTLIRASHAEIDHIVPDSWGGAVGVVTFNLGYLPGGDRSIITLTDSTLVAIKASLDLLRPGGIVTVMAYPGHPGGDEETTSVRGLMGELAENGFAVECHSGQNAISPQLHVVRRTIDQSQPNESGADSA